MAISHTTRREYEYKSYFIRIEEHPNVYIARIHKNLDDPPLGHIESGARARGQKLVLAAAKNYIDHLVEKKVP